MSELVFLFAIHNHQPVGNFSSVFEKAFKECYFPLLNELRLHPSIKFSLHFSGPLWEYMREKERECWETVAEMVQTQQIELIGGGFYEPIFSLIPEEDRIGQIEMMNRFIEENFGVRTRGFWLAERVWEPHLTKTLHKAGKEYTLLDEEHFHYAGIKNIHTYYITEEEGYPLKIFPIDKKLRYLVPFRKLEDVGQYFHQIKEKGGTAILGDDGEKFGLWPGTNRLVYEQGWLREFLNFLETEGVRSLTLSEFLDEYPAGGKVYLPPASYEEMMEWTLEPEDYEIFRRLKETTPKEARRFLRGGFFRDYLLKYPESNHLHKRMLFVSRKVNKSKSEEAKIELYKGQCNDAYWHGIFGGLYLPHLREAAYLHLLKAESCLPFRPGWSELDYDLDGKKELFYQGERFNLLLKPSFGGGIVELDDKLFSRNLSDVLSRRKESYHLESEEGKGEGKSIHEMAKELPRDACHLLRYDWYPRFSLLDHFFHPNTTKEDFMKIDYGEKGDFVNKEYEFFLKENKLLLLRQGSVWVDGKRYSVEVKKEISPETKGIRVDYVIENTDESEVSLLFGSEWNFYLLPEDIESTEKGLFLLKRKLFFEATEVNDIWHFPLQTLSQSEKGYDIILQGMCLVPVLRLTLQGKEKFSFDIGIKENNGR